MNIYDVTLGIGTEMITWPGDPRVQIENISSISAGNSFNVSHLAMSVHTGTHVDAPHHIIDNGKTIDEIPISTLVGRAYVLELPEVDLITAEVLMCNEISPRTKRILFKTRNSIEWDSNKGTFKKDYVALSSDAALYLVRKGIKLIGVDYLSVAPYDDAESVHKILLDAGVVIIEGLNLTGIRQGRYTLYCLPLKIIGADGAPARVFLTGV